MKLDKFGVFCASFKLSQTVRRIQVYAFIACEFAANDPFLDSFSVSLEGLPGVLGKETWLIF